MEVKSTDTGLAIRREVATRLGRPEELVALVFHGVPFTDQTAQDAGLGDQGSNPPLAITAVIKASAVPVPDVLKKRIVIADMTGGQVEMDVKDGETIGDIKQRLAAARGVPSDGVSLIFGGKALADGQTVADANIQQDSTLVRVRPPPHSHPTPHALHPPPPLSPPCSNWPQQNMVMQVKGGGPFKLTVKTISGTGIEVEATPEDTVAALKAKIQAKNGVEPAHMKLVAGGVQMSDDNAKLKDFKDLKEGATVFLVLRLPQNKMVKFVSGQGSVELEFPNLLGDEARVVTVKGAVAQRFNVDPATVGLNFRGSALDDGNTLGSYGIDHESEVTVTMNVNGGRW